MEPETETEAESLDEKLDDVEVTVWVDEKEYTLPLAYWNLRPPARDVLKPRVRDPGLDEKLGENESLLVYKAPMRAEPLIYTNFMTSRVPRVRFYTQPPDPDATTPRNPDKDPQVESPGKTDERDHFHPVVMPLLVEYLRFHKGQHSGALVSPVESSNIYDCFERPEPRADYNRELEQLRWHDAAFINALARESLIQVCQLTEMADYFGIIPLVELAISRLAIEVRGRPSVESLKRALDDVKSCPPLTIMPSTLPDPFSDSEVEQYLQRLAEEEKMRNLVEEAKTAKRGTHALGFVIHDEAVLEEELMENHNWGEAEEEEEELPELEPQEPALEFLACPRCTVDNSRDRQTCHLCSCPLIPE